MLSPEQKLQIRMNVALTCKDKPIEEIEAIFKWIVKEDTIVPVKIIGA